RKRAHFVAQALMGPAWRNVDCVVSKFAERRSLAASAGRLDPVRLTWIKSAGISRNRGLGLRALLRPPTTRRERRGLQAQQVDYWPLQDASLAASNCLASVP